MQDPLLVQMVAKHPVFPAALPNPTSRRTEQVASKQSKTKDDHQVFSLNQNTFQNSIWEAWGVQQKRI